MAKDDFDMLSAYEADLNLRYEKNKSLENELSKSKAYISILNDEINKSKEQIEVLKASLYSNEREMEETKNKGKSKIVWIIICLLEAVLIIVLFIAFFRNENFSSIDEKKPSEAITEPVEKVVEKSYPTLKLINNLEERVNGIDSSKIAPFKASVLRKENMEYLCFSHENLKILYRNEFLDDGTAPVLRLVIDNGNRLSEFNRKYSFDGELSDLCPQVGKFLDKEMDFILFSTYSDDTKIPEKMEFFDTEKLVDYEPFYIKEAINKTFKVEFLEKLDETSELLDEDISGIMSLNVHEITYNYSLNQDEYVRAVLNEEDIVKISNESSYEISDNGISIIAVLKIDDDKYLGEFQADVVLNNDQILLHNSKYGAYVFANQEDVDNHGIIRPYHEYIEDRVTIGGLNMERFIIQKSSTLAPRSLDIEKLNTHNPDDWKYLNDDGEVVSIRGIDVSKYQGNINWQKVKESGVDFAIIRLGYRGMNEGTLEMDPYYKQNVSSANKVGINTGVYFFSQAINVEEAVIEAEYVLKNIKDYDINYPICFDTERVTTSNARANNLSRKERTDICIAFCERIRKAGYTPMIYANTKYMIMGIDLERLTNYEKWFAFYGTNIIFPYDFSVLQYSESGSVPGISGAVDLNISLKDFSITN